MVSKGIKNFEKQLRDACDRGYLRKNHEDKEPRQERDFLIKRSEYIVKRKCRMKVKHSAFAKEVYKSGAKILVSHFIKPKCRALGLEFVRDEGRSGTDTSVVKNLEFFRLGKAD